MTQQFKFGDLVIVNDRSSNPETGVIVWINDVLGEVKVCFEENLRSKYCLIKYLKPVPHPDTVRLDWLVENDCALTKKLCDEDGDILGIPNAVIQKQEDHFEVLAATSNDIREAIDVAMAHIEGK